MSNHPKPAIDPLDRKSEFFPESGLRFSSLQVRPQAPAPPPEPARPAPREYRTNIAPEPDRKRLAAYEDINELLLPIRKHWPDKSWPEDWCLYWMPASFENKAKTQGDPRFLQLLEGLIKFVSAKNKVRHFTFFDQQLTYPHLMEHFLLNAIEYLPVGALGFCPGRGPVAMPKYDQITGMDFRAAYEKLKEKKEAFQMTDLFPGMPRMQHFILGDQDLARNSLLGRGGYTFLLSEHSQNRFGDIAKQILSENTKDPLIDMIPFAVPLFDSRSFLTANAEKQAPLYFSLFDLYVGELPSDQGIIIAAKHLLDDKLIELVESCGYRRGKRAKA